MALDRCKLTRIGHGDLPYWNPLAPEVLEHWTAGLGLGPDHRVLDVGCGRGELLIRLVERFGCAGVGVDPHPEALVLARAEAARRIPGGRLELRAGGFDPQEFEPASFELGVCVGATQAFEGFETGLWSLREQVRPGGHVLIGEGYWKREPVSEYLELLGCEVGDLHSHLVNIRLAEEASLEVLQARETSEVEWAAYEDGYTRRVLAWADAHPDDPDTPRFREHIEAWRAGYLAWGHDTLGFGLYLLRRPF